MTRSKSPSGLTAKSRAFYATVVEQYELRVDERMLLEDACREMDLVDVLSAELAKAPELTIPGRYAGTMIAHPLLGELASHRRLIVTILKTLGLPDEMVPGANVRSVRARAAAQSRWATHYGSTTPVSG